MLLETTQLCHLKQSKEGINCFVTNNLICYEKHIFSDSSKTVLRIIDLEEGQKSTT
jgi:hypothetical protein